MISSSLPRSFKTLVQTLLVGRSTLDLDDVIAVLRENERMMRTENVDEEHNAITVVELERGRNHLRRHDGTRGRSKWQSHPQRDTSNMQCYYCSENGYVQVRCKQMKEDLEKLKDMNKDGINSQTNVVKNVEDEDDVLLATNIRFLKQNR